MGAQGDLNGDLNAEAFGSAPYPRHLILMSLVVLWSLRDMPSCRHPFMYAQKKKIETVGQLLITIVLPGDVSRVGWTLLKKTEMALRYLLKSLDSLARVPYKIGEAWTCCLMNMEEIAGHLGKNVATMQTILG